MNGTKYADSDFGELTWDSESSAWVGHFHAAELRIAALPRFMEASEPARHTFLRLNASEEAARRYASTKLLELYNTAWSTGTPINAPTFIERLALATASIDDDGSATFSYRDDDMFAGHYIVVSADPTGDFFDASLCG